MSETNNAVVWVKSHILVSACLASFVFGVVCGFLLHAPHH